MIVFFVAEEFKREIDWITNVIFDQFLGLDYCVELFDDKEHFKIVLGKHEISIVNTFLLNANRHWLKIDSIPRQSLQTINLTNYFETSFFNSQLPIIFGKPTISRSTDVTKIGFDIIGAIFFILSGYEDAVKKEADRHGRLPFKSTITSEFSLITRPIVDEYIDLLWTIILEIEPSLKRKEISSKVSISCDVDVPYSFYVKSFWSAIRTVGGDLFKRKSLPSAIQTITNFVMSKLNIYFFDPVNKFDWIMDVNESFGHRTAFNFISGKSNLEMDGHYSLDEKRIRELIKRIHDRGHEIGLHASYDSCLNPKQISSEAAKLRSVLLEENIEQPIIGSRQHYLKFSRLKTFKYLESAGITYDSTVGFAEHAGFRSGTARSFTMYDLDSRRSLVIRQKPLIVMENSLLSSDYMGMKDTEKIISYIVDLKCAVEYFGGEFSLLWHNSSLDSRYLRGLYKRIINLL